MSETPSPAPNESEAAPQPEYRVEPRKRRRMTRRQQAGMTILLGSGALAMLWTLWPSNRAIPEVEVSAAQEFQGVDKPSPFGAIESPPAAPLSPDPGFAGLQDELSAQRATLEGRNGELQARVDALQAQLAGLAETGAPDQSAASAEIVRTLKDAQAQNLALIEELRGQLTRAIEGQNAEIAALQADLATRPAAGDAATSEREADLARRRAEKEEELRRRVVSPAVVFDDGPTGGTTAGTETPGTQAGTGSRDAAGRDFVQLGREPTKPTVSQVIANPSNTVLQGTMIDATLENAVDSSLPGQLSAIVTRPVWSFDQVQELIPAGSRLVGEYSSDISLGQGRILVAWTRLVTPDGQSVEMQAFGGDAQGRSGITGNVNTRFGKRFGGAALVSLISAIPGTTAAKAGDSATSDVIDNVTEDFSNSVSSTIDTYINLPPIITLEPGAAITVMVDRDLEIW